MRLVPFFLVLLVALWGSGPASCWSPVGAIGSIGSGIDQVASGVTNIASGVINTGKNILKVGDIAVSTFTQELVNWSTNGVESALLKAILRVMSFPKELRRVDYRLREGVQALAICTVCQSSFRAALTLRQSGVSDEKITDLMVRICTALNIEDEKVCDGAIRLNAPILFYIMDARPDLSASTACGVILQSQSCPLADSEYNWTVTVDANPQRPLELRPSPYTGKVLQITDIHYDPMYQFGSEAKCDEPTCCRRGQNATGEGGAVSRPAGFWGDYNNCDAPWHAVVDALMHIRDTHPDLDYIYFTGDIIDHGVWETTKEGNIQSLVRIYREIRNTFPNHPVYPILGNHEPNPMNQFSPRSVRNTNVSTAWVYEVLADIWIQSGWLPESTRETILTGGFYTVSPRRGFRIIVLNSNVCYTYNWWLLYEPRDMDGQLQWLADTLLQAERNGEVVHILSHIPSGSSSCLITWSREFRRIVTRFSSIITAQFNGHTHNDELQLFYDPENRSRVLNVAWNGAGITTYSNLNPNYKIYHVDANTMAVRNYESWIYNLTEANLNPNRRPNWFKSYSFKEEYGIPEITNENMHQWVLRLKSDRSLLELYHRNFWKYGDTSLLQGCNGGCLQQHLCSMVTSRARDDSQCSYILNEA